MSDIRQALITQAPSLALQRAAQAEIARLDALVAELRTYRRRYETLRTVTPNRFAEMWKLAAGQSTFDQQVDALADSLQGEFHG